MRLHHWSGTLFLVCALASGAASQNPAPNPYLFGPARGVVDVPPADSGGTGSLDGFLESIDGALDLYRFQAILLDVRTPCLSCEMGELNGTLDDGVGAGPDFIVKGVYRGAWVGTGLFSARIFRPGGTTPIGVIHGRYRDPIGPQTGEFAGRFHLRR